MSVVISSVEVVPFLLVLNLLKEYVGMSTASAVRNPQSNYLAIKKKNTASFGKLPHKFKS
ncbi:hypothetical protein [Clostridium saccharobutylicum]|uniref:Uncharacterized protein n=1 Tax=Clostridium saccharobutylicum DSM 13864 TaxID=1345695 RepID=U5MQ93_CLOSA|nr:hypothetical protein [Clostridium saccharobutylicum]AGX42760.1 hypothetical protein CLSA_c17660 [Clostridium saccharobutylicum DSM 13864]MBA2904646.1 hypothetical protein [Clostridium saccharobutylicum]MBA8895915.1 hypothetical protein [Clostridium saccharobutylicum]MBA8981053.1 hypothetical protein [Clostridium saccharobutylicum]MBA8999329.1 hypothetical protein [Clostridium saccharobutylicum]